jgi:hypothetical protein
MLAYVAHACLTLPSPFLRLGSDGAVMMVAYTIMLLFIMGQKSFYLDLFTTIGKSSLAQSEGN